MEQENYNIKWVSLLWKSECVVCVGFSVIDRVLFSSSFYFLRFWLRFFLYFIQLFLFRFRPKKCNRAQWLWVTLINSTTLGFMQRILLFYYSEVLGFYVLSLVLLFTLMHFFHFSASNCNFVSVPSSAFSFIFVFCLELHLHFCL